MADHPFDTRCREIALVMDGLRRTKTVRQRQVTALTTPLLKRTLDGFSRNRWRTERDRALILIGMAGALRRSEIVALDVSDLTFSPEGVRLVIRRSKGDQLGEGQVIAIARTSPTSVPSPTWKPTWSRRASPRVVFSGLSTGTATSKPV